MAGGTEQRAATHNQLTHRVQAGGRVTRIAHQKRESNSQRTWAASRTPSAPQAASQKPQQSLTTPSRGLSQWQEAQGSPVPTLCLSRKIVARPAATSCRTHQAVWLPRVPPRVEYAGSTPRGICQPQPARRPFACQRTRPPLVEVAGSDIKYRILYRLYDNVTVSAFAFRTNINDKAVPHARTHE